MSYETGINGGAFTLLNALKPMQNMCEPFIGVEQASYVRMRCAKCGYKTVLVPIVNVHSLLALNVLEGCGLELKALVIDGVTSSDTLDSLNKYIDVFNKDIEVVAVEATGTFASDSGGTMERYTSLPKSIVFGYALSDLDDAGGIFDICVYVSGVGDDMSMLPRYAKGIECINLTSGYYTSDIGTMCFLSKINTDKFVMRDDYVLEELKNRLSVDREGNRVPVSLGVEMLVDLLAYKVILDRDSDDDVADYLVKKWIDPSHES